MSLAFPLKFKKFAELAHKDRKTIGYAEYTQNLRLIDDGVEDIVETHMRERYKEFVEHLRFILQVYGDWDGKTSEQLESMKLTNHIEELQNVPVETSSLFTGREFKSPKSSIYHSVKSLVSGGASLQDYEFFVVYFADAIAAMLDNPSLKDAHSQTRSLS